jgi:hypothetical protein
MDHGRGAKDSYGNHYRKQNGHQSNGACGHTLGLFPTLSVKTIGEDRNKSNAQRTLNEKTPERIGDSKCDDKCVRRQSGPE